MNTKDQTMSRDRRRALKTAIAVLALSAWMTPSSALAQHETAADLLDGERAFRNSCANCHGPDGDVIAGIDLGRGQFRRQMSDDDLVRIIRTGIPNTPMPATSMTVEQAQKIVAYLRSTAATRRAGSGTGDATRGRATFDGKGGCTACHSVGGAGSGVGPDLTRIGALRGALELQRSLVEPAADVQATNRFYRVVLKDGTTVTGRLLTHDTFTVQMLDTKERLRSFVKSDLRQHGFLDTPMPSYQTTLTAQEIADVVSYLVSLKGRG
jgi:putative heme-binding domain-containing protein